MYINLIKNHNNCLKAKKIPFKGNNPSENNQNMVISDNDKYVVGSKSDMALKEIAIWVGGLSTIGNFIV